MSTQFKLDNSLIEEVDIESKVNVSDLISRMKKDEKIEKKRNLALGIVAFSAVTVFGIILTI